MTELRVGKRFFAAANWAAALHGSTPGALTPSVAQVLGVASLVLGDGGSNRDAIVGMLVDAGRGDPLDAAEVRSRFGKKSARLVVACTNALADPERLETEPDPAVVQICAAVTVHDLQALVRDVRRHGSVAFARFAAPPNQVLDRYRELVARFRRRLGRSSMLTPELRVAFAELERDAELDTAVAAWRVAHVGAA
jgi:(p)ppGpp synthase/HD superfamily hydrolase